MYRYDFQEYIIVVQCSNMYVVGVYISPAIVMIEWFFFGKGKECNYIIECWHGTKNYYLIYIRYIFLILKYST